MTDCRLLIDPPRSGVWNMAADEALLESAARGDATTLRFYRWEEPTLTLGYFQRAEDRAGHRASRDCAMTRRASGGGAILHDRELTYSFAVGKSAGALRRAQPLYDAFHETLIEVLRMRTVDAVRCTGTERPAGAAEPFLCFQRRTPGDVLLGDAKIVGSAQRRRHGAVLQHGSLLLAQSPAAPELPGVAELAGVRLDVPRLLDDWIARLADRLQIEPQPGRLEPDETDRARTLQHDRFGHASWICKR